jgi:hypothetical protein
MSNHKMQVDFFGKTVRCNTDGLMISLNDMLIAGNTWRIQNGLPMKQLSDITGTKTFASFKEAVCHELGVDESSVLKTTKGRNGGTMAHMYLAIYIAEQMSPEFHVKVIKTFVEGKLLEFRDYGGTEFKTLNAAIDLHLPGRENKTNTGCYIQAAKALRAKILGPDAEAGDWDKATVSQTHARYEAEKKLSSFLEAKLVRDWDHLKSLIDRL